MRSSDRSDNAQRVLMSTVKLIEKLPEKEFKTTNGVS